MTLGALLHAAADYLAARFPAQQMSVRALVAKKEVPVHRMSWAYYLGGLTLFFLAVSVGTGLMLLFYYEPTVSDAYASVQFLTDRVTYGHLIRDLHAWSASAMIVCVVAHLLTAFAMKAFAPPRELTWIAGVLLLLLTFAFSFTGYLLPWDQIAVNATKVALQSVDALGAYLPGAMADWPHALREIFQGEASIGQATLSRFYALHVVVLPLALLVLIGIHLLSVQLHGMSRGIEDAPRGTEKFFPFFIIRDFTLWGAAFLVLFIVALNLPFSAFSAFPLHAPFDPLASTPEGIKPEWYFFCLYYPLEVLPFWAVFLLTNGLLVLLFLVPWVFRHAGYRTLRILALAAAAYFVVVTAAGHLLVQAVKGG